MGKEEISQNEYKRGISCWNFDLEDMKAQASLIQDEDVVTDKYQLGSMNSFPGGILSEKKLLHQLSSLSEASESAENEGAASSSYSAMGFSVGKCDEDELSISSSTNGHIVSQTSSPRADSFGEFDLPGKRHMVDGIPHHHHHHHHRAASSGCIPSLERVLSYNGSRSLHLDDFVTDAMSKASIASGVQQKGRFKVTSEGVDLDKGAVPLPVMQKSHSMQFILQTNTLQRDCILSLMKANSTIDSTANLSIDGASTSTHIPAIDKSVHDPNSIREKELLNEITYLQWRLASAQEELHKC